ncbi:MAG: hypothetical protein H0V13_03655 [Nocardioidaceae bacterium]|nr:hypothetical protein [Nocardioidaceae bacterium]
MAGGPDGTVPGQADVYLHIGLPKTGTSHLQQVLWLSRERLSADGVLVPGATRQAQRLAVWDLMGRRPRGAAQPEVAGSWQALVDAASGWSGSHVVVSEEFLTNARPRQARRAVDAFAPARVHVVLTVRDLGQVVGSVWQQGLAKGHTWSWEEFIAAVRDPASGPATAGGAFWLHQDLVRVLDTWETVVPRERIHLVTVPPASSSRHLLLERFAAATRLDTAALVSDLAGANVSVGVAEAEVLRRLNQGLGGRLNERQYAAAVQHGVKPALRDRRSSARIQVPAEELGWLTDRATAMVAEVRARGYQVAGDLRDLIPAPDATDGSRPDEVDDSELADAAIAALVAVTEKYAELSGRARRVDGAVEPSGDGGRASQARAHGYRAQMGVLRLADRNRWARKAVATYIRRSSRTS